MRVDRCQAGIRVSFPRKVDIEENKQDVSSSEKEFIVLDSDSNSGDGTREMDTEEHNYVTTFRKMGEDSQVFARNKYVARSSKETDAEACVQEKGSQSRPRSRWSDSATHALIDVLNAMLTKENQWLNMDRFKEVSLELKKRGFHRSLQDCRQKLKSLKRTYYAFFKRKNKSSAFWAFQTEMEGLMKKLHTAKMSRAIQSEKALVPENCRDSSVDGAEDPRVEEANDRIPKPKGEPKWGDKSVTYLLSLYSTMADHSTNGRLGPSVWEDIARTMARNGFSATASQCCSKANDLMRIYEELVKRRTAETLSHCDQVLYEQLSAVFVTNPIPLASSANDVEGGSEIQRDGNIEIHGSSFEIQEGDVKWSDKSVTYLLRLYSTKADQLTDDRLAACAWEDIARIMTRSGFSVTASQCSSKANDLMRICKELAKRRTSQALPPREQVLYEQLSTIFGNSPLSVECSQSTSNTRKFEIKGATFEEQMTSYLVKRLAQQDEHERTRHLHHKEKMEMKRKLIGAFSDFLKYH